MHNTDRLINYCYVGDKNVQHLSEKNCLVKNMMNTVCPHGQQGIYCSTKGVRRIGKSGADIHMPGLVKNVMNAVAHMAHGQQGIYCSTTRVRRIGRNSANIHMPGA